MIRIRNRAMARIPGTGRKRSGFQNGVLFSVLAAGAAVLAGITGTGYVTVLAADNMEQNQVMAGDDSLRLTGGVLPGDADDINIHDGQADDTGGVYDFKDNKTTGTVTVTKVWDDGLTNEEREIPDIKISTKKPSKSTLGYTLTFHGNGMKFADGSEENMVVYNSAGEIVQGEYKLAIGNNVTWCRKPDGGGSVEISSDGFLPVPITKDIDLWAKEMTFDIKGCKQISRYSYENNFNKLIPDMVTEIVFTDEIKPAAAEVIDVDADGDGGVVAWTENNGTVMKVSTQIKGMKVQAAVNSRSMFSQKSKLKNIDLKMLDTSNVTTMYGMFSSCRGLTSLDLTPLNISNVTNMEYMFCDCSGLTTIDLSPLNTANVTNMHAMFDGCSGLTSLDLTPLDTSNVTNMGEMFSSCRGLRSINMTGWNTSKVKVMQYMFYNCYGLTSLDLTPLDTSKVTNMSYMFQGCSGLTSLDLTPMNTSNVTNMRSMFNGCSGLTSLDLSPLDTTNVTNMHQMFSHCRSLTSLDLTPLNTSNVTNMSEMFDNCSGLTSLDLTPLDTSKVTNMRNMFYDCDGLATLTTGTKFKFVGTDYYLSGTWQNTAGETFTSGTFPSNVADTYTKISS